MTQAPVNELNIVIIHTPDLEAARTFYRDVMGLRVESETPAFLLIESAEGKGSTLGIGVGEPSQTGPEIWWRTENTDALHTMLVSKGVRILAEPKDEPFGRSVSFADPAGNVLNAYQPPR